jgi:hypothetical protein
MLQRLAETDAGIENHLFGALMPARAIVSSRSKKNSPTSRTTSA